jgi:hypothetical protein
LSGREGAPLHDASPKAVDVEIKVAGAGERALRLRPLNVMLALAEAEDVLARLHGHRHLVPLVLRLQVQPMKRRPDEHPQDHSGQREVQELHPVPGRSDRLNMTSVG